MQQGDVIAGRFDIEALAGAGGMGQVFRARDRHSGEPVAVKVLRGDLDSYGMRFGHETRVLSELSHPSIVRYVAHGVGDAGEPYLAMEWLEGEDLSCRLERAGLTIGESVSLASRVAEALGAAHARNIVHRDLKPSNIFLVGQRVDQVKVLDFGIARLGDATRLTQTGMIMGTPGYMAPEQVQNDRAVDSRADVFSLGCVLFECLTGTPAFGGEHLMALLAKVLFAEPARPRDLRPEVPAALEALVLRMLAKEPDERPRDGAAVAEALRALGDEGRMGDAAREVVALTSGERRTISVVLVAAFGMGETNENTTPDQAEADTVQTLRKGAVAWGGRLEYLRDGSVVVSIAGAGLATDQAAQAARCALWLRRHAVGRRLALSTGQGDVTGRMAAAMAIDRAAKLIDSRSSDAVSTEDSASPIAIDETTARLLDGRFDVRDSDAGPFLHGEREMAEGARLLLKKPTPCVGRDRELANLSQMFVECIEEPQAQAALVTGTAGMGKSRLLHELLTRLRQRGEPFAVWMGRGDVLRAGSTLGLLGQALRGTCGIRGDEPLPERREKLSARVAQRIAAGERQRVAQFLGEIVGVPFPDDASELLRAARGNAQIMTDQMRRAWVDFLRAECEAQPVLLVFEDLHWGDFPTVQFVDAALRELADRAWMVLAIARPEVSALFPTLWEGRHVQEIHLKPLGKKACERLVRQVLGEEIGAVTMERLIAQADGNAFYLEELIRAAAEHRDEGFPETVVAMVQSRLAALEDEDRRALRAAAVFGEAFWPGGVAVLLDIADRASHVKRRLFSLVEREVLVQRPKSRFSGEVELAFRHMLLREGAYAMLTDDDRTLGHRLAGKWLERAGEREPKLLAEHFDRGGEGGQASAYYLRAAEQALEGGDCEAAITQSVRGIALGREPEVIAGLRAVEAEARFRSGNFQGACRAAGEALGAARPGSRSECKALYSMSMAATYLSNPDMLTAHRERLLHVDAEPDATAPLAAALNSVTLLLVTTGQRSVAIPYLRRLESVTATITDHDALAIAWVELTRAQWAWVADADPWGTVEHGRAAAFHYERAGARNLLPFVHLFIGCGYGALGLFDRAEEEFSRNLVSGSAGSPEAMNTEHGRAVMLVDQGRLDEASAIEARLFKEAEARGEVVLRFNARVLLAEILFNKGEVDAAESEVLELARAVEAIPLLESWRLMLLARIRLAQGCAGEAKEICERALTRCRSAGIGHASRYAMLLLLRAEVLHALGDHDAAREAIREACEDLLRRAAKIPDSEPEVRRCFLENLPDHRRTLELAREWLGEDVDSIRSGSSASC